MSKYVRPIIVGAIVALVLSFGLSFLLSLDGQPHRGLGVWTGTILGVIVAYIMANLAGNRRIADASAEQKKAALAAPPAGKTMLYVYREGFVAKLAGLDIAIDGRVVAQLKSPRFTAVIIPAGQHTVRMQFAGFAGAQSKVSELAIDAPADGAVALKVTMSMGMVKGGIVITPQPDLAAVRQILADRTMTPADVAEI
jgi:hypothetical protein